MMSTTEKKVLLLFLIPDNTYFIAFKKLYCKFIFYQFTLYIVHLISLSVISHSSVDVVYIMDLYFQFVSPGFISSETDDKTLHHQCV